jgi:YVTN family beta-propeller protein
MKVHRRLAWAVALLGCVTFHACQERQPPDSMALAPGVERASARGPDQFLQKAVAGPQGDGTYVVATTQIVSPAGESVVFAGRPTDLALSPDESLLAVKSSFDLVFIDVATRRVKQVLPLPESSRRFPGLGDGRASYCGIAWSRDGARVWITDAHDTLHGSTLQDDGSFRWTERIHLPGPASEERSAPGGLALDEDGGKIYVALSRNNSIGVVSVETKRVEREIPVGIAPFTILLQDSKAYVTNWGGRRPNESDTTGPSSGSRVVVDAATGVASTGSVSVIDLEASKAVCEIPVGLHPSGMAFSAEGSRLFVANANSDTISVIDTAKEELVDTIGVKPMPQLPYGSAPNAVAVTADGVTLYVANGGNNAVAAVDIATGRVKGFIPTGWYPGAVAFASSNRLLLVANVKGFGSRGIDHDIAPHLKTSRLGGYNSHDYVGSVSIITAPSAAELAELTERVAINMRLPEMGRTMKLEPGPTRTVPVPTRPGEVSVFKHVLYIIKENRTYDQIFGDMEQGNGDPTLCLFGREVTPNHHALAEEFVLFDNFYCNGVLSADGHQWTDEGYVTDYIEKSFGGFPRSYPYDGDDALAYSPGGFIWDQVLSKGLSFRVYGEFVQAVIEPADATWTDIYRDYEQNTGRVRIRATTELHTLEPYLSPRFVGFPSTVQDVYRAREFIREFEQFESDGNLPNFMIMLLPNDHTSGTREGFPTPRATVADNDLALGRIVEAVSKSRFWPETVIFVVEDDPQDGVDHVDGRRTVAFCISPYTKRRYVDSNHYNQNSLLRTMELILGLDPMTQLDMAANPLLDCFQETPNLTPYTARPNQIPLDEMNLPIAQLSGHERYYAKKSMELPLDDIDLADEGLFNRILWHSVKGYDVPYPTPVHRQEAGEEAWSTRNR